MTDLRYGICSIHDFDAPYCSNHQEIKDKYDRRIEQFFTLLESDKSILFIRFHIHREEAEYLDDFLHTLYPQLSYTLVAVSYDLDAQEDWELERVRNFYMPSSKLWSGDPERWKEILDQFSIEPSFQPDSGENLE